MRSSAQVKHKKVSVFWHFFKIKLLEAASWASKIHHCRCQVINNNESCSVHNDFDNFAVNMLLDTLLLDNFKNNSSLSTNTFFFFFFFHNYNIFDSVVQIDLFNSKWQPNYSQNADIIIISFLVLSCDLESVHFLNFKI